ncbi:MAG: protein kinase [bacterium]|nr:protein kinase [bacterium]
MPGKVTLRITAGPMAGESFSFEDHDTFLFGRRSDCHVSLPTDAYVSRHHFLLEANPPAARLRDLGSMNGTFINGRRYGRFGADDAPGGASKHAAVRDGDEIRVGDTTFQVCVEGAMQPGVVQCQECGLNVSEEESAGREGAYICAACRSRAGDDPVGLRRHDPDVDAEDQLAPDSGVEGYEIERCLGRGGMGTVYLARRTADERLVALKVMLSNVAVDEEQRERFLRHMEGPGKLHHPNVVAFLDRGCTGGAFYFVMEYCNRGSLADLLDQHDGRLPLAVAAPLMRQALKGLVYAHGKGCVHRDLTPHNILLHEENGVCTPKLADFALAKEFEKAGFSGLNATSGFDGRLPFVPREQVTKFKHADPASDVWSMAAILYLMLTGVPPRPCADDQDLLMAVLDNDPVPLAERGLEAPEQVAAVIETALAVDPLDRYMDACEFLDAFTSALRGAARASEIRLNQ